MIGNHLFYLKDPNVVFTAMRFYKVYVYLQTYKLPDKIDMNQNLNW